jgi:hypothetical protein
MSRILRMRGSRAVPAEVSTTLGLTRADRVLAWSPLVGGGAAVATVDGLRVLTPRGTTVAGAWVEVDHAAWDADSRTVAVWWTGRRAATPLEVEDDTRLPEVIRERVQASVLMTGIVEVPGGQQVRVALRRGHDGTVSAQALPPPGVRLDDPGVGERVSAAVAELRAEAGIDVEPGTLSLRQRRT